MARETLDKILKYQNGGKPKPKKRIIFAEAPISTEVVVTPTKKGITKGVFDQDQMRIGRAELYDEAVKIKNKFNLTGFRSGEDFNEFADEVIDVINKDQDYNELTRYLKDNFNIDVSNETGLKKAYSKATGFTGINKYGIDNFKFSERKFREEDFIDEAKAIARASKQVDNIPTEIVPLYGYEDFNKVKEKYTKDYLNDADVVLLGHHSTDKIGGIDTKDWDSFLSSNMDKENICYGGICHGGSMAEVFNNIPNFTGTINDPWIGIPRFNDYKGKGSFEELFFGNQISDRDMEDGEVKVVKPKYGVDYNNYTLNPKIELKRDEIGRPVMTTTLIDDLIQRVVVPDVTPLPTNIDPIKRQNGGMKNTKYPIKPKFSYQGGGYAELQGDAGSLLREIMKGTSLSGMFDKQTGSYTPVTGADYLKEKGYSKPYPKKDAFGNVTMYVRDANGNEIDAKAANAEFEAYNKNQAAQFNQNQEEFNKMLPLTQNLAGLFDLQQREQDEIANKKLRVQDFPTSYSSYAPVGFAEEGGGVSMEKSSYPSLSALYKGLPKGMSKKHKEMVASSALKEAVGISLNNYKQKMGYRNDSPFKNEPSQNIHSNVISMDNVDKTLLAIPDVGIPKMLTPNSGTHFFPGASTVTEIPKAQDGKAVSQRDSIAHQANKILKYEQLRGGPGGVPLPQYKDPKFMEMLMNDILPEVERIMPNASAMEKAEAMDFIFNAGYDKTKKKISKGINKYQSGGESDRGALSNALEALNVPQKELMNLLFGERKVPSELMTGDELGSKLIGKENYGLLADLLLDPLNLIPLSKAKYLIGLKGQMNKQKLSKAATVGNTLWGADKINDLSTLINSEQAYPFVSSFVNRYQSGGTPQFGGNTFAGFPSIPLGQDFANATTSKFLDFFNSNPQFSNITQTPLDFETWRKQNGYENWGFFGRDQKMAEAKMAYAQYRKNLESQNTTNTEFFNNTGLPLAQNLFALQELQDTSALEADRGQKVQSYSLDNKIPEMAFKGYFQNGGDMKQQTLGYKDNSPYKNLPYQDFNTNTLTMDGVSRPILALPNVGQPRVMLPNSGIYQFPLANQVREIPLAQNGRAVSQRDSIAHQADKILKYEQLRGGEKSRPLPKYGDPMYMRQLMEGILPEVDKIMPNASAIEKAEAMDFIFNAGWDSVNNKITVDPRAYALQEYYRKYAPEKLTDTYWPDGKSWAGRKGAAYSFDEEYNNTIGKLSENERRILMNKGRDWFYQHRAPIGSTWDLRKQGPHPNYEDTWYGRIWNTNDYSEFNPNNPKFIPSRQEGGMSYPFLDSLLKEDNYESSVDDEYIKELIKKNEGSVIGKDGRHKIYKDKEGYPTIGYGHLVRGVEATSLTQENADKLFDKDYKTHKEYAEQFPGFNSLNKNQQAAIIDMTFNMGEGWFERFPKFMEAMNSGDYKTAKKELENSLWYTQVGKRAQNNINLLFSDSPENTKGGLLAEKSKDKQNLSNSNKYSNLGSDQKAQYFSSLQNYVKNNGIEALESSDSDAAEFYKNSALQVVMSDDSGMDYELPEIEVKAKKSNKKTENRSNSKFEYNPYVDVELPREKVNYMRDVFGLNFREIGNKNKESSLNELASVLQSLFESNGALLNNGIPKMIFDPSKSTQGGIQKTKNMKKIKSYLQGGSVIRKDLIANEDSKANSYVNLPQLIPIQTEIKETVFLLPTGDLVDTNARKRHSKMSENEVTDIVPEDSYVFSQFGDAKIYRDDASQIVMQIKTEPYNTKKTAKMPEVKTLGDVMTKNVMSPADLTRVVSNMFKTVDLDDPFTVQTNEANKFNRNAYLHAIMGLAEYDKARKGIENDYQTQMQDQGPAMVAKQGGTVKMNYKVPKAFDPLSLISLVPSLIGVINDFSDKKRLKQNTALNAADIRDYEQKAYANNDASTVISGLGTILQDTKVTPVINDTSYLDDINTNNMAYLDTASRRLTADAFNNRLDTSSMTPQQAMLFAERDNANRYESLAKSTVDLARTRAASFEKYRLLKGEADNANNASRVGAENATRAGNNSRLGILSGIISGGLENKTNIAANVLDANMANRGNYASNISQINSNTARNLQSAANVGLQMYSSEQAKKAAEAEKRGRKAIEYKEECTAQGYNWICAPDGICYCDN